MKIKIIILLLLLVFLIPIFVYAQDQKFLPNAGFTPESRFYFFDIFGEKLQEFFTFSSESKVRLQITFAAERIAEIKLILETKGVEAKGLAVAKARLKKHLDGAAEIVVKQKEKGKDVSKLVKETDDIDKEIKKLENEKEEKEESSNFKKKHDNQIEQSVKPDKQALKAEKDQVPQNKKMAEQVHQNNKSEQVKIKSKEIREEIQPNTQKIQQFITLEKELMGAQAGGSYLSPEHSNRIQKDLTNLENQNYDGAEIKRLRAIVLKLSPHLQDQLNLKSEDTSTSTQSIFTESAIEKPSEKSIIIKNLGVSFEPWDKNSNRAGAFLFLQSENKVFLEYGIEVQSSQGGTKILPTFEYRTAKDADVFSAIDGVITKIEYQTQTQDYEILIQPETGSQWTLGHDHVSSIRVSEGDRVKAGDILGKAGTLGGELGRTEIMIWGGPSSQDRPLTYCPFKLFAPELLSDYQQKISRHMKDWEEFKGNSNLYDEGKHVFFGCLKETIFD